MEHLSKVEPTGLEDQPPQAGLFKVLARYVPYFRNPQHVLVFKLDCLLLTWTFIAGILKEMDQSATSQAYVSGMKESLNLYGNELINFNTLFSVGYAIGLIPGQLIQTKVRPSIFLPFCEISWGVLVTCIAQAPNAKTIYALRVLLGLFSAVFWPTAVSMIFNWYTPTELAKRIAFFNVSDAAGGMFLSALQAALYTNMNGVYGIAGWQWLFIVSGTITIGQGLLGLVIIPDSPVLTRAIWLTDTEKRLARKRMADFGANTSNMIPTKVVVQKLQKLTFHPMTYFFLAAFALQAWANRANSYFTLYLNLRFSTYQVNVIPIGGYALQILINLGLNALSDWKHWRWQISVAPAFFLGIVLSVLSAWPSDWRVIITFYFLTYATNAGSPSLLAWMAELLKKEPEARSIIVALTVTIVYIGHATIPIRVWRTSDSPRYPIGFPLATAFIFSSIFVQLGMLWWGRRNTQLARYGYDASNVSARLDEEISEITKK
ncbi:unnamed protein product [Penicillium nalgiovense]|uniref:Major facilitator superfamily (MFS) profile domain-containing protein n=1 Tax=Penicillium nalgiovense TaxID=60175 RepID=A0A9W4N3P2_PENNA|nr:unnamed protein product [Penicillium nalgiovense]CAG7956440.1 unnamed protein product [Penicillium nalgiovense]CAG7958514.1 unnamed protein product [Penicillium nalgiovense]CAG7966481.1 unnamed protein product [Penicillium nalgiovense]CAG7975283.1 unnamed protein product [Penicillium nalgiovense]